MVVMRRNGDKAVGNELYHLATNSIQAHLLDHFDHRRHMPLTLPASKRTTGPWPHRMLAVRDAPEVMRAFEQVAGDFLADLGIPVADCAE